MPWKECHLEDARLRFVARLLDGEKMAALCRASSGFLGRRATSSTPAIATAERGRSATAAAARVPPYPRRPRRHHRRTIYRLIRRYVRRFRLSPVIRLCGAVGPSVRRVRAFSDSSLCQFAKRAVVEPAPRPLRPTSPRGPFAKSPTPCWQRLGQKSRCPLYLQLRSIVPQT